MKKLFATLFVFTGAVFSMAPVRPPPRVLLPKLFIATVVVEKPDKKEAYTVFSYVAMGTTRESVDPEVADFIKTNYGNFKVRSLRVEPLTDDFMDEFCAARLEAKRKNSL